MEQKKYLDLKKELTNIYLEFDSIYSLHNVEKQALAYYYEQGKDYGDIMIMYEILSNKFKISLNNLDNIICKM